MKHVEKLYAPDIKHYNLFISTSFEAAKTRDAVFSPSFTASVLIVESKVNDFGGSGVKVV